MALPDGLYDLLLTEGLNRKLSGFDPEKIDLTALKGPAAGALAELLTRQLSALLEGVAGEEGEKSYALNKPRP